MDKTITCLGRGGDHDRATILGKMEVQQSAAKTLMDFSAAQDFEAGDGKSNVGVIVGAASGGSVPVTSCEHQEKEGKEEKEEVGQLQRFSARGFEQGIQ